MVLLTGVGPPRPHPRPERSSHSSNGCTRSPPRMIDALIHTPLLSRNIVSPDGTACAHGSQRNPHAGRSADGACGCSTCRRSSPARCAARSSATSAPTSSRSSTRSRGDSMRGHGPAKDGVAAVVEGDLPQQAHGRPEPVRTRRAPSCSCGSPPPPTCSSRTSARARWSAGASARTRCTRSTPAWSSCGSPASARPGPYAARRRLRHPRRGDERLRPPHRRSRTGRRRCRRSAWPTASAASPPPRRRSMALLAPRAQRRPGPGRRHEPARADHDRGRPRPDRLRPARRASARGTATGPPTTRRATPTGPATAHWVAISTSAQRIAERVLRLVGHPEVIDEPWFASGQQPGRSTPTCSTATSAAGSPQRTRDEVVARLRPRPAPRSRPSTPPRTSSRTRTSGRPRCSSRSTTPTSARCCMHNVMWRMSEHARPHPLHRPAPRRRHRRRSSSTSSARPPSVATCASEIA